MPLKEIAQNEYLSRNRDKLFSEEELEVDVKYCNSQYSSVLQLANKLKEDEARRQVPNHQSSTFSNESK